MKFVSGATSLKNGAATAIAWLVCYPQNIAVVRRFSGVAHRLNAGEFREFFKRSREPIRRHQRSEGHTRAKDSYCICFDKGGDFRDFAGALQKKELKISSSWETAPLISGQPGLVSQ